MDKAELKNYDITVLVLSDDFDLTGAIKGVGGENVKTSLPTKVKLAYPIKKHENAFMVSALFNAGAEKVKLLEDSLRLEKSVLRQIVLCVEKKKQLRRGKTSGDEAEERYQTKSVETMDSDSHKTKSLVGDAVTNKDLEETIKQLK